MRIYFETVKEPEKAACNTDAVIWHVLHGWCYNVWDCSDDGKTGRIIAVFYVTQLCGFGGILHFDTVVNDIPPAHILAAMRKGVRIVSPHLPVMLATIPVEEKKLLQTVRRMGFRHVATGGPLLLDRPEYMLLQYFPRRKPIVNAESNQR